MTSVNLHFKLCSKISFNDLLEVSDKPFKKILPAEIFQNFKCLTYNDRLILYNKSIVSGYKLKNFDKCINIVFEREDLSSVASLAIFNAGEKTEITITGEESGIFKCYKKNIPILVTKFDDSRILKILPFKNRALIMHETCIIMLENHHFYHILQNSLAKRSNEYQHLFLTQTLPGEIPHKKFWIKGSKQKINDVAFFDDCNISTFEQLRLISCFETFRNYPPPTESFNTILLAGENPFIGFYFHMEDDDGMLLQKNLSDQLLTATSRIKDTLSTSKNSISANMPTFLKSGKLATHTSRLANTLGEATQKVMSRLTLGNIYLRFGIQDATGVGIKLYVCPNHKFAVATDCFGRISVLDLQSHYVLYLLKGYRDAYCCWIKICDASDYKVQKTYQHYDYLICVYAPRRGLIEVWALTLDNLVRVHAQTLAKNGSLIESNEFILGKKVVTDLKFPNLQQPKDYYFLEPDGKVFKMHIETKMFQKVKPKATQTSVNTKREADRIRNILFSEDVDNFERYLDEIILPGTSTSTSLPDCPKLKQIYNSFLIWYAENGLQNEELAIKYLELLDASSTVKLNQNSNEEIIDLHSLIQQMSSLIKLYHVSIKEKNLSPCKSSIQPDTFKDSYEQIYSNLPFKDDLYESISRLDQFYCSQDNSAHRTSVHNNPGTEMVDLMDVISKFDGIGCTGDTYFGLDDSTLSNNSVLTILAQCILHESLKLKKTEYSIAPGSLEIDLSLLIVSLYWIFQADLNEFPLIQRYINHLNDYESKNKPGEVIKIKIKKGLLEKTFSPCYKTLLLSQLLRYDQIDALTAVRFNTGLEVLVFFHHLVYLVQEIVKEFGSTLVVPLPDITIEKQLLNFDSIKLNVIPVIEHLVSLITVNNIDPSVSLLLTISPHLEGLVDYKLIPTNVNCDYTLHDSIFLNDYNTITEHDYFRRIYSLTILTCVMYQDLLSTNENDRLPFKYHEIANLENVEDENLVCQSLNLYQAINYLVAKTYFDHWVRDLIMHRQSVTNYNILNAILKGRTTSRLKQKTGDRQSSSYLDSKMFGCYRAFEILNGIPDTFSHLKLSLSCHFWTSFVDKTLAKLYSELEKSFDNLIDDLLCERASTELNLVQLFQVCGFMGIALQNCCKISTPREDQDSETIKLSTNFPDPGLDLIFKELNVPRDDLLADLVRLTFYRDLCFVSQVYTCFKDILIYIEPLRIFPPQLKSVWRSNSVSSNFLDGKYVDFNSQELGTRGGQLIESANKSAKQFVKNLIRSAFNDARMTNDPLAIGHIVDCFSNYEELAGLSSNSYPYAKIEYLTDRLYTLHASSLINIVIYTIPYWLIIIFKVWCQHPDLITAADKKNDLFRLTRPKFPSLGSELNVENLILYTISTLYAKNWDGFINNVIVMFPSKRELIACHIMNTAGIRIINYLEDAEDEIYRDVNDSFTLQIQMWLESLDPSYEDIKDFKEARIDLILQMFHTVLNNLPGEHSSNCMARKICEVFYPILGF